MTLQKQINKCKKYLFEKKSISWSYTNDLIYSQATLKKSKAMYQARYCWIQSLVANQKRPDPCLWCWNDGKNDFEVEWMTMLHTFAMCCQLSRLGCFKKMAVKNVVNG